MTERLIVTIEGDNIHGMGITGLEPGCSVGIQLSKDGKPIDYSDRDFTGQYILRPVTWEKKTGVEERPDASLVRITPREPRTLVDVSYTVGEYAPLRKILDYSDIEDIREFPLQCSLCANVSVSMSYIDRHEVRCAYDDAFFEARTFLACDKCTVFTATAARGENFIGKPCPECKADGEHSRHGVIVPYWPKM